MILLNIDAQIMSYENEWVSEEGGEGFGTVSQNTNVVEHVSN